MTEVLNFYLMPEMTTKVLFSQRMLLGALILLLGIGYGLHSDGDLMFDDEQQIAYVSAFGGLSETFFVDCFGLFRPVKNVIFYAWITLLPDDYQLWRLTAIAAFLGLIPMAYAFMRLFYEEGSWMPLFATTIWAIAPANTTIVNWISGTNILVCAYGFFIYYLLYERLQGASSKDSPRHTVPYLLGSLLALAFSCLSYEAAITAPFLLILKDYVKDRQRLFQKQTRTFLGLSILIVGAYFYQRSTAGGMTNFALVPTIPAESDLWVSLSSPWMVIVHAMRWLWPYGQQGMLILFNPEVHKGLVLSATAVLAVIIFVAVWFRDKHPYFFLGLGWYGIALLPMANALSLGPPSVGIRIGLPRNPSLKGL
ncbi:MAG: hypothetical protein P8L44_11595 [Opitutales bacterium]|nr:hypothetical protein [Opitutales bacterium]